MSQVVQTAQKRRAYRSQDKFGIDHLVLSDLNPEPLALGQVRVKLHAASLNYRDLMIVNGTYNPNLSQPTGLIPLSDAAGEVIEAGEGVSRFKVGDRVAGLFFQRWNSGPFNEEVAKSSLAGIIDGVLTTSRVFAEDGLITLPEHLSFAEGATLPCAALTAWNCLITSGQLKPGESVLVQGSGGVSIFALQFAKLSGATVIMTSGSDDKLKRGQQLGADHVINYKSEPNWEDKVRQITSGKGVDHVVEVGGAGTLAKSLKAVRMSGKIGLIGVLTGNSGEINPLPILRKAICLKGIFVGSREMFEAMNKAITANQLRPIIDRQFPFEEAKQAFKYLESGAHFGKVVINIA